MDSPTKTVPASGGRLTINDFASNTNCDYVSLSTSVGTITPTEHTGKWGETTSIDYVLDIPATVDARTIVVTGSSKTSDGIPINSELKIQQASTHTFEITTTIVAIDTGGGTVTKKYKTSAPSIQLELTGLPSCVSDFSYTQPVDGVGTFSVTYDSNYLKQGRYVRFYVVASYEGTQIAKIRESDWQGGTAF